jgi:hypothetical protein
MLRRPATTIQLTQGDLDEYDVNRAQKVLEAQQAQKEKDSSSQSSDATEPKEEVQEVPMKSKKDRIMGAGSRGA